jgi:hypothetical protein
MSFGLDAVLLVALAASFLLTLRRYPFDRALLLRAGALFAGGLALRVLVPWAPANFYSDLAAPFPSFRFNPTYAHPLYDALWRVSRAADAPFVANVLLGAMAPPLLYLALRGGPAEPGARDRGLDERAALPFAVAVAALPLFVRLSASDAPHVFGLFAFALGAVCFARAEATSGVAPHAGFLIATYLVGATRRELAVGPMMYAFLAFAWRGRAALRGSSAARLAALALACAAGLFWTPLVAAGRFNSELQLSFAQLVAYVRGLPEALLLPDDCVPWLFRLGLLVLLVGQLRRRRPLLPIAYAAGMILFTLPYALEREFAHAYVHPLSNWAFSRYALVWYLFPTYFGVLGVVRLIDVSAVRARPPMRAALGVLLCANVLPEYRSLHAYQAEYLFLRGFLAQDRTRLPIVVGWQKYAGVDFCEALAQPFFGVSGIDPARRWIVLDAGEIPRALAATEDTFYYFSNTLPRIRVEDVTARGGETAELGPAVCAFRSLDCLARRHGHPVYTAPARRARRMQFDVGDDQSIEYAIFRVERPASGWDLTACAACAER